MNRLKKQAGSTLLELVMAIGIIATITIAAIVYFNAVNKSNKINNEVHNINALSVTIRNMFNSQGNYLGLNNTVIIKSKAFPERMRVPGSIILIKNSWLNAGVVIMPVNNMGSDNDSFNIMYFGVPGQACVDLISKTFRSYDKISVNGTITTSLAMATTTCRSGANAITFTDR